MDEAHDGSSNKEDRIHRRAILGGIASLGVGALLPGLLPSCAGPAGPLTSSRPSPRRSELIREENQRPGTTDWLLTNARVDPATRYRSPAIEGYASRTSVRAGETISFHVSTRPASRFAIDLYRMGYYGGAGARHLERLGSFPGSPQEDPPIGLERLRRCRWEPCTRLTIPKDWPSGIYLAKLTCEQEGLQSYLIFIVRDDREADFLFQCSDNTWQAYNRWPSQFSLYDDGKNTWYWGAGVAVSFDRPYGKYCQIVDTPLSIGSGEWLLWEFPLSYWLESEGYDVTYISNVDTHADPAGLLRAKGLISVGHDEYYSMEMFLNLKHAIEEGLSVAFLSGNTCCGLIELRPASDGTPNRAFARVDRFGPPDAAGDKTFPDMKTLPRKAPSENTLIGARSTGPVIGGAPWICALPDHWIFEGTGMKAGDGIPGLVGWEWHGDPAGIPGLEVVAKGVTHSGAGDGLYTATVYPGARGNLVFNAATCWWADGLAAPPGYLHPAAHGASPQGPDPRVQRITANVLARMRAV